MKKDIPVLDISKSDLEASSDGIKVLKKPALLYAKRDAVVEGVQLYRLFSALKKKDFPVGVTEARIDVLDLSESASVLVDESTLISQFESVSIDESKIDGPVVKRSDREEVVAVKMEQDVMIRDVDGTFVNVSRGDYIYPSSVEGLIQHVEADKFQDMFVDVAVEIPRTVTLGRVIGLRKDPSVQRERGEETLAM